MPSDLKKLAEKTLDQWDIHSYEASNIDMRDWIELENRIEFTLQKVRDETIEECADLVDAHRELGEPDLRQLRDAIRSLKSKESEEK